jgi:hypothetical protein
VRSDAATVAATSLMTCPDACHQAPRSRVRSVVVLDIVGSNRSLGSLAPVARTAARYSNLCALRLPLADIHIRSRLHRPTATLVVVPTEAMCASFCLRDAEVRLVRTLDYARTRLAYEPVSFANPRVRSCPARPRHPAGKTEQSDDALAAKAYVSYKLTMSHDDSELSSFMASERARIEQSKMDAAAARAAAQAETQRVAQLASSLAERLTRAANEFYEKIKATSFYKAAERSPQPTSATDHYFKQDVHENSGWWFQWSYDVNTSSGRELCRLDLYITIKGGAYPNWKHTGTNFNWQKHEEVSISAACRAVAQKVASDYALEGQVQASTVTKANEQISAIIREMATDLNDAMGWKQ